MTQPEHTETAAAEVPAAVFTEAPAAPEADAEVTDEASSE
jgi:hypothetical protein